jgi:hypothetical protein
MEMRSLDRQLDLGYGDPSIESYFWKYCMSREGLYEAMQQGRGCNITMAAETVLPPWPSAAHEAEAREAVLTALASQSDSNHHQEVRKRVLLRHLNIKNDHFTKTGSGQTQEKLKQTCVF